MLSALAVVTNCALIILSPQLKEYMSIYGPLQVVLYVIIAEVCIYVLYQHDS